MSRIRNSIEKEQELEEEIVKHNPKKKMSEELMNKSTNTKDLEFEAVYNRVKELARMYKESSDRLNKLLQKRYGFTHNDIDFARAIDTLDYGTDNLKFKEYKKYMEEVEIEDGINAEPKEKNRWKL